MENKNKKGAGGKPARFVAQTTITPTYKRPRQSQDSPPGQSDCTTTEVSDTLIAIDNKLSSLDERMNLIEVLHKEFNCIQKSLEFSQDQILKLTQENKQLKQSVATLTNQVASVTDENKLMKEAILVLQSRSMRDNLIFSGISEPPSGVTPDPERAVKEFMTTHLKIPSDKVNKITFHRVHRLGPVSKGRDRPRPIIAKFEHFKQKEMVKQQGRELKGTDFGMNDQFPREIMERRKILFPIRKKYMEENKKAVISVDRLYVDGQLYRDSDKTPWLF